MKRDENIVGAPGGVRRFIRVGKALWNQTAVTRVHRHQRAVARTVVGEPDDVGVFDESVAHLAQLSRGM